MLASRVVFFPRLRDTEQCTCSLRRDQARKGERELSAPISSTKTNRSGSELSETVTLQRTLHHSPRSAALTLCFLTEAYTLLEPPNGGIAQSLARGVLQEATPL
jgi:hypothetical protein